MLYRTLERFPEQVTWRPLKLGREEALTGADGKACGLLVEAVAVPGKPPIHLENRPGARTSSDPEDNIGLQRSASRHRAAASPTSPPAAA